MTYIEAKAEIEKRTAAEPFAILDDILEPGWGLGISFRGYPPLYLEKALEAAETKYGVSKDD